MFPTLKSLSITSKQEKYFGPNGRHLLHSYYIEPQIDNHNDTFLTAGLIFIINAKRRLVCPDELPPMKTNDISTWVNKHTISL